ncbi:S-methyl-5'-thioadenosine phosphorylase [Amorphoplanes digitatis]|uniref:S-methyl-5'-thioadenosine phosphorylase n=1 Tax=Actinoplanes digitatis TaxID=1868 RepID=A0A7W7HYK0_9ACTN|nr:S-methyl-5'-thioadenosine phosphorylase [Actinoplanes digitatis]MBB4763061.1 5'-methylthioadenosine phosphorylase [Actinoplanes digitatis]GID95738.1 S-methyl-5'-thioadenosine phosphorylase [Actinoplanes digitatis]
MINARGVRPRIGVIGGSGLYDLDMLDDVESIELDTPYGSPSGSITIGTLRGTRLAFLPRHGLGHRLSPSEVPARANIYALCELGVRRVFAISAVGGLAERYAPGTLVVPDQIVDRTKGLRPATFFGGGVVAHVSMADPFCQRQREHLIAAAKSAGHTDVIDGATYCCIEGPQFSTRAESHLYRSWGLDIIGMTAVPEAALAREAQLCYAGLALVTDYDCWHENEETVTADMVAQTMRRNVRAAREVLEEAVATLDPSGDCECRHALTGAVLTDPTLIAPDRPDSPGPPSC